MEVEVEEEEEEDQEVPCVHRLVLPEEEEEEEVSVVEVPFVLHTIEWVLVAMISLVEGWTMAVVIGGRCRTVTSQGVVTEVVTLAKIEGDSHCPRGPTRMDRCSNGVVLAGDLIRAMMGMAVRSEETEAAIITEGREGVTTTITKHHRRPVVGLMNPIDRWREEVTKDIRNNVPSE